MMNNKTIALLTLILTGELLFASHTYAGSIQANFSGRLLEVPCKFGNTADLDFDFKNVVAQEVDGKTHFVDKTIAVTCDSNSPSQLLTLRISGTPFAGADKNIVDSGLPNMGIALTNAKSGNPVELNEPIHEGVTDGRMSFNLRATLMNSKPGTTLDTGDFSTELTLSAKFE